MLKNYLKIALRNFFRRKNYSLINIAGLGIGIAACLIILQYVRFEQSFDRYHEKADQIYRVVNERFQGGKRIQIGTITYPTIGPAMAKDYPEVAAYTRLLPWGRLLVTHNNEILPVQNSLFADEHFLDMFSYDVLAGETQSALQNKYSVVLTESEANRIFDLQNKDDLLQVVGKALVVDDHEEAYQITAVIADVPENSIFEFDLIISYNTLIQRWGEGVDNSWTWSDFRHFIELEPGTNPRALEAKFDDFSQRYFRGDEVSGSVEKFFLQPLTDVHLGSAGFEYETAKTGNRSIVFSLLIVAIMILIIAWMNYINLSTVRAFERAKEVGVRKVLGSSRSQLIRQFFAEALLFNLVGLAIAVIINEMAAPYVGQLLGVELSWRFLLGTNQAWTLPLALGGIFMLGVLLSAAYPAFVLSAYKTASVLKGKFQHSKQGTLLRRSLVVFQFCLSIAFIAATIITFQQLQYLNKKDLGIDLSQKMIVRGPELTNWDSTFIERTNSFKNAVLQFPGVEAASTSLRLPGDRLGRMFDLKRKDSPEKEQFTSSFMGVDYQFFETYEVDVIAGRPFRETDHDFSFDNLNKVVINASAVKLLGYENPEAALNQGVTFWQGKEWEIIGVVNDFHQESLRAVIEPILFFPAYDTDTFISFKISQGNTEDLVASIQTTFQDFFPNNSFDFFFLEDRYRMQYQADYSFAKVLGFFSLLAIIVACLGLFGLVSYAAVIRSKEIGIRKILGASMSNLFLLLTKDFSILLLVGLGIAIPLTYYGIQKWLSGFAYHVDIQWWVFALAGLMVLLIAFISVAYRALKAATVNPVESLRYE